MADGLPPHDVNAEEAVVAAILLDADAMTAVMLARLEGEHFFREANGWVIEAGYALAEEGLTATLPSICHQLEAKGQLDQIGGEPYLVDIVSKYFTSIGVETHIRLILDTYRRRQVIQSASLIAQLASETAPALKSIQFGLDSLGKLLSEKDAGMEKLGFLTSGQQSGLDWCIPVLDKYTMGMAPGKLTILAGGPGSGKSMLAVHIVKSCLTQGGGAAIFTLEMSNEEYQDRMVASFSGVKQRMSKWEKENRPLTTMELLSQGEALTKLQEGNLYSRDKSGITLGELCASARMMSHERHIDLVVADYLQLMGTSETDNEASALKEITGGLKNLAMEIGCHVVVVSQMNRSGRNEMRGREGVKGECVVTGEKFGMPAMEFLMGGSIEADGDSVIMLAPHTGCGAAKHVEVCLVKNRNGVNGSCMMLERFDICRFELLTQEDITRLAHGDIYTYRTLMRNQGMYHDED